MTHRGISRSRAVLSPFVLVAAMLAVGGAAYGERTPLIHTGGEAPNPANEVVDNDYWNPWTNTAADPYELVQGNSLWIGAPNEADDGKYKAVAFRVYGTNLEHIDWSKLLLGGTDGAKVVKRKQPYQVNYGAGYANIFYTLKPQVDGEWIRLVGGGNEPSQTKITKVKAWSACYAKKVNVKEKCIFKKVVSHCRLTELWYFPDEVAIEANVTPTLDAPDGSGNWTYGFVDADPYGEEHLLGGVKWTSDGDGILEGQEYGLQFSCVASGNATFTTFCLDADTAAAGDDGYIQFDMLCVPTPPAVLGGLVLLVLGGVWRKCRR